MAHAYGSRLSELLAGKTGAAGLGEDLGAGLTTCEVRWLRDREWARTADDVLMRRTKLGLVADPTLAGRVASRAG